jgi:hypothetical protein
MIEMPPLAPGAALVALARCAGRTVVLIGRRRIHQPTGHVGSPIAFADGTAATVYRETVVDRAAPASPAVLLVCFRLRRVRRRWAHALFRLESELNTVLFVGFPGFVSKLWLTNDGQGTYRGIYQWDDPVLAHAYVRALWWPLALVSERESIHYAVLSGLHRDEVLEDPAVGAAVQPPEGRDWWRVCGVDRREDRAA